MNTYEHGNWYCRPANKIEAAEIIQRALASGAVDYHKGWQFDCNVYGVFNGVVGTYQEGTEYSIQQLREKFPSSDKHAVCIGEDLPPVGWHGEITWGHKVAWHECVVLPEHVAYKHDTGQWVTDALSTLTGFEFRALRTDRERWVDDAAVIAHKNGALTPEQSKCAAGAIYDAFKSGKLKAPEVA